jgi:hypothetical protein
MIDTTDRDERFNKWFSSLYANLRVVVLWLPERVLPRKIYGVFANLACDTAEPVGKAAGSVYNAYCAIETFVRWLVVGKAS